MNNLSEQEIDRVIEMAWEDRTPFEAISYQFGLEEEEVIQLMRNNLKEKVGKDGERKRQGRKTKHLKLRSKEVNRHKSSRQKHISGIGFQRGKYIPIMSYFKSYYLTFLFFLITIVSSSQNETNRGYKLKIGDELPSLTLHMMNGETWTNKDFENKVVVIQFTGSWCSVCKKEMPHLEEEFGKNSKTKIFFLLV